MNPFATQKSTQTGVAVISIIAVIVGVTAGFALKQKQDQDNRIKQLPFDIRQGVSEGTLAASEEVAKLRGEITDLRKENTKLQTAASTGTNLSKELNESLQKTKEFACLTELEGPGVTVTLRDASAQTQPNIDPADATIHDADLIRVINELWNAGAEGISVNNKRSGPGTSYRCVGSVIVVDNERFAPPIVIRAVGDPQALYGGLSLPGGIIQELKSLDPQMAEVAIVKRHKLPAYDGSTTKKWAKTPQASR